MNSDPYAKAAALIETIRAIQTVQEDALDRIEAALNEGAAELSHAYAMGVSDGRTLSKREGADG